MKNKLKIFMSVGLMAGQMLGGAGAALAAGGTRLDSVMIPTSTAGPEAYIKQINLDADTVNFYYLDQGGKGGAEFTNLNIVWPRNTEELRAERPTAVGDEGLNFDELAMDLGYNNPWWAGLHYNARKPQISSGGELTTVAQWPDYYQLKDNRDSILYYSLELTENGTQKYWIGKADYSKCMRYYQPGVICEAEIQENGEVKYVPFLNGEMVEMVEEKGGEDGKNGDAENDGGGVSDVDDVDGTGSEGSEDETINNENKNEEAANGEEKIEKAEQVIETASKTIKTPEPVLLAGVKSAVIDSGSGGQWVTTDANVAGAENEYEVNDESAEAEAAEIPVTEDSDSAVVDFTADTAMDVPELGKEKSYWGLVLGAMAAAAAALMIWWWIILPIIKQKKEEDEKNETSAK